MYFLGPFFDYTILKIRKIQSKLLQVKEESISSLEILRACLILILELEVSYRIMTKFWSSSQKLHSPRLCSYSQLAWPLQQVPQLSFSSSILIANICKVISLKMSLIFGRERRLICLYQVRFNCPRRKEKQHATDMFPNRNLEKWRT